MFEELDLTMTDVKTDKDTPFFGIATSRCCGTSGKWCC